MDIKTKQEIINVLKYYFNDILRATYQIRKDKYDKWLTLDEYHSKIIDNSVTKEDSYKVKLSKEDIKEIFLFIEKYFGCVELKSSVKFSTYLVEILGCANFYSTEITDDKDKILKYMEIMLSLEDSLIEKEIEGKIYQNNNKLEVNDYLGNLFIKHYQNGVKSIVKPKPVITLDKLHVMISSKKAVCVCDYDSYFYDLDECRMYSKDTLVTPLYTFLNNEGANFLLKPYYSEHEISDIIPCLNSFKMFKKDNYEYAKEYAMMFFCRVIEHGYSYTCSQCNKFVEIIANEILQQLYLEKYALIHNEYPNSSVFDEACSESRIKIKEGALALEVSDNDINIMEGYAAIEKIYRLTGNK